jgi:CDGSH-type Zn-finger protein
MASRMAAWDLLGKQLIGYVAGRAVPAAERECVVPRQWPRDPISSGAESAVTDRACGARLAPLGEMAMAEIEEVRGKHVTIRLEAQRGAPVNAICVRENGPLAVNGPLEFDGSVKMVSGTGRTFDRAAQAFLRRCGGSQTKPYCDGTHRKIGFTAD